MLFNSVKSSADKRAESQYKELAAGSIAAMRNILSLAETGESPKDMLVLLLGDKWYKGLEDKALHQLVLMEFLSSSEKEQDKLLDKVVKTLVRSTAMHELPVNSAAAIIATSSAMKKVLVKGELMATKAKLSEEGDLEFKLAMLLLYVAELAKLWRRIKAKAKRLDHVAHNHEYDVVHVKINISERLDKYINKKLSKEPSTWAPCEWSTESKGGIDSTSEASGSHLKIMSEQTSRVWDRLNKLQSVKFKLNHAMIGKHLPEIRGTLPSVEEMKSLDEAIEKYWDESFQFSYNYGPDNGRIYGNGHLIPSQSGGRNWIVQFAEERPLTDRGVYWLKQKLEGITPEKLKAMPNKKKIEYYNYIDALEKHAEGKPVGNMIGIDGIVMGPQTHSLLLGSAVQYQNTVVDDKRVAMAEELGLTKDEVKGGISPYGYGAGRETTINGIYLYGDSSTPEKVGNWETFYVKWEELFQKYFPATYALRKRIQKLTRASKGVMGHNVQYTTLGGFKANITALKTHSTMHNTVYGKGREFRREVFDSEEFGSKMVAAIGHELDSSILAFLVDIATYDIKPVHDEYCVHPNDVDDLIKDYVEIAVHLNKTGYDHLTNVINEMFSCYLEYKGAREDLSGLMIDTLDEATIRAHVGIN